MINHTITVRNRRIKVDTPQLIQGCAGSDSIILDLDDEWTGLDEMEQLLEQAQTNAKPDDSYAPLADRVKYIEERLSKLETGSQTDHGEPKEPADKWPEYKQPTGAYDAYHVGDKITYNGKHYTCIYDGCVWNPDTYPQGWQLAE